MAAETPEASADDQRLAAALDDLAETLSSKPGELGSAHADLAAELAAIGGPLRHARTALRNGDRPGIGVALQDLVAAIGHVSAVRIGTGDLASALMLDRHAVTLVRTRHDGSPIETATALRNVARDLFHLGDYAAAATVGEEALTIASGALADGDPALRPFLDGVAGACVELGRYAAARSLAEQSLRLTEANFGPADRRMVAALQTLESVARATGRLREALDAAQRALDIQRAAFGEESFPAARAAGRLAAMVAQIGEKPRARLMLQGALETLRKLPRTHDVASETATTLANLAGLAGPSEALPLYEEALALRSAVSGPHHPESVRVMSNVGLLHCQAGDDSRAIAVWSECLALRRKMFGDMHPDVARSLIDVAFAHHRRGDVRAAKRELVEALAILGCYDTPAVTARAHLLLASVVAGESLGAAVMFGKLVVNTLQDLRSDAAGTDGEVDRAFVTSREGSYRQLGDALITSGRLPEAQQALAMLKELELFEITLGGADRRVTRATLTPLEARWAGAIGPIQRRLKASIAANGAAGKSPEASREPLGAAVDALGHWLDKLVGSFKQSECDPGGGGELVLDAGPQSVMPEATALVQYLLSPDHLRIIVTTPTLVQDHHVRFAPTEVHRLVFRMRSALQDATDGFLEPARRLYDTLITPVLAQLREARIRTLALSLDGVLRYVPMAALHDGTRYLIEDFALVLTAGQSTEPAARPPGELRACGLGVTRAIGRHPALHGVRDELLAVIRTESNPQGLLPGEIWLDEDFTVAALAAALSGKYPVVHVSSHFAFRAAQEASSFLLLGDGAKLTVADLAQWRFDGVELMVLSACDTATGGGHGHSGREIEGLGSLVRHLGARSVIATLWPVRDFTTAVFMRRFYENWHLRRLAAPEALRQAQLSLCLGRTPAAAAGPDRKIIEPDDEEYIGRWTHPRFWAPYLLMGEPAAGAASSRTAGPAGADLF